MAEQCHPERSEGSRALDGEMLRGVYTERSECAQHDKGLFARCELPHINSVICCIDKQSLFHNNGER